MARLAALGLVLTAAIALGLALLLGPVALLPAAVFGGVATAIQLAAVRVLGRAWQGSTTEFFKGVGAGMALRLLGVVLMALAIILDRAHFPPIPTAAGFLGVLLPLLFLEVRFVR